MSLYSLVYNISFYLVPAVDPPSPERRREERRRAERRQERRQERHEERRAEQCDNYISVYIHVIIYILTVKPIHENDTKITKFSIYSPCQAIFIFRLLLLACMCCSNVKVTAEIGLKCICVYIHPSLNSSRSEVSRFGPACGMT